jgi:hypothetical protein
MMQLPALRKHRFFSGSSEELLKNCAGSATTKKILLHMSNPNQASPSIEFGFLKDF